MDKSVIWFKKKKKKESQTVCKLAYSVSMEFKVCVVTPHAQPGL